MGKKQSKENPQPLEESVAMNPERSHMTEKEQLEAEEKRAAAEKEERQSRFQGLSTEELLQSGNTAFWKVFRNVLLAITILSWVAMGVAAIVIVVLAPRCPDTEWYEKNAVYQVYSRSFQDSDGDGMGDLKGIQSRIGHFEDIHTHTLLLSNILQSNDDDLLYAVTDFKAVDSQLGTQNDLHNLLETAHLSAKELKVVLEFIPNHSSENHPWFQQSRVGNNGTADTKFRDYYVWANGQGNQSPPNNWLNVYGDPAWTYEPLRDQWYYHTFTSKQPDLNLRNEDVQNEIEATLEHWLNVGVDGFLIRDVSYLCEAEDLADEPVNLAYDDDSDEYNKLKHTKTLNQPENYELVSMFKKVVRKISDHSQTRTMMVEPRGSLASAMGYYGVNIDDGADVLYNYQLLEHLEEDFSGTNINALVDDWTFAAGNATDIAVGWYSWVLGDMHNERVASRYGHKYIQALNALIFTLPGVPITYYGEEIGMESSDLENGGVGVYDPAQPQGNNTIPVNRIGQITPMQWNAEDNAGFSNSSDTWLPINPNHQTINVEAQKDDPTSVMAMYKEMVMLRESPSLLAGKLHSILATDAIYAFRRQYPEWPGYFVAINLSDEDVKENYREEDSALPAKGKVVFSSHGNRDGTVKFDGLVVHPAETIVVEYEVE
ncbi:amino acid transporter heavy chain SLC3A1-like [Glandiceps talaboti]